MRADTVPVSSFVGVPAFPALGYVLASALLPAFPLPVRMVYAERLRFLEPGPDKAREARAALLRSGLLLPGGELSTEGRKAAWKALREGFKTG